MNRREKLLLQAMGPEPDETKAKMLDTTVRLIMADLGQQYCKFWEAEGPGVMCFEPENKNRSMFYLTLEELHSAKEQCERDNNDDLAESFRRILESAQKINPEEGAGYLINDQEGMRFCLVDYQKVAES